MNDPMRDEAAPVLRASPRSSMDLIVVAIVIALLLTGGGVWLTRHAARNAPAAAISTPAPTPMSREFHATDRAPPAPTAPVERAVQLDAPSPGARTTLNGDGGFRPPGIPADMTMANPPATPARVPRPVADLVDLDAAPSGPSGQAGIVEALRDGHLRIASRADLDGWTARSGERVDVERLMREDVYVITRDFTMPGDLYGAHAVVFLLPRGVPFPRGDAGHSMILDVTSGRCVGPTCEIAKAR